MHPLTFPVLAISPSGIDVYELERDLATCHRRAVKSSYRELTLIDSKGEVARVEGYRARSLPPRPSQAGGVTKDLVWVEIQTETPKKQSFEEIQALILAHLETYPDLGDDKAVRATHSLSELVALFVSE